MKEQERTPPGQENKQSRSFAERINPTVSGTAAGAVIATAPEVTIPLALTPILGIIAAPLLLIAALLLRKLGYWCHDAPRRIVHITLTSGISSAAVDLALVFIGQ